MMEMGPAVRGLIDSAAATVMARDALEATLLLKRLAHGLSLVELVHPHAREELALLMPVLRLRAEKEFVEWTMQCDMPGEELRAGLESYERCCASEMAGVLHDLTPAETARETLEKVVKEAADRGGILEGDIVARDIGWELVKAALNAAKLYAEPLKKLAPPPLARAPAPGVVAL